MYYVYLKTQQKANNNGVFGTFKKFELNLSNALKQIVAGVIAVC